MTLNNEQIRRTSAEHHSNFALTGLTRDEVADDLGWTLRRLEDAMGVERPDPIDSWELRDYLLHAVRDANREPVSYSILTSLNKVRARMWFPLRTAPRHDFSGSDAA